MQYYYYYYLEDLIKANIKFLKIRLYYIQLIISYTILLIVFTNNFLLQSSFFVTISL